MTYGVLESNQPKNSQPRTFIQKHLAKRLIKRGWAEQISKTIIRRLPCRRENTEPITFRSPYIPDYLPPVEIPGVIFRGPVKNILAPSELGA